MSDGLGLEARLCEAETLLLEMRRMLNGFAARIAAQSELLSASAERSVNAKLIEAKGLLARLVTAAYSGMRGVLEVAEQAELFLLRCEE